MGNVCDLDWDKGLWRVTGTLYRRTTPNSLFDMGLEWASANVQRQGNRSLLLVADNMVLSISELHAHDARPLAAMGWIYGLYRIGEQWPDLILKHMAEPRRLAEMKKSFPKAFNGLARI